MNLNFGKLCPKLITSKFIFSDLVQQKQQHYETNGLLSHQSRSERFLREVQKIKEKKKKNKMMKKLKMWRQGLGQKGTLKFNKQKALAKLIGIVKSSNLQHPTCKRKKSNQGITCTTYIVSINQLHELQLLLLFQIIVLTMPMHQKL